MNRPPFSLFSFFCIPLCFCRFFTRAQYLLLATALILAFSNTPDVRAQQSAIENTSAGDTPTDGTPQTRFTLEQLLAPTETTPLPGNDTLTPNAQGQYTVYALERTVQDLFTHLQSGAYAPVAEKIAFLRDQRIQTTDGMSAASFVCEALVQHTGIGQYLQKWIEAEPEAQVAYLLYGLWGIEEAWRHRGSGRASTVTQEGWQGFHKYLELSDAALGKALDLQPQDYVAAARMITVSLGLNQSRSARYQWFERAKKIYPDYYEAYSRLGMALLPRWGGFPAEARLFALHNADRGPQFPMLYYSWLHTENADDYRKKGNKISDSAWEILEKYLAAFPQSGNAYRNMSIMQSHFGNNAEALQYAEKAILADPSSQNRYNYARRLHTAKENASAIAELKAAIALNPYEADYWDWLGRNYFTIKARNMPLAIECFTRAIELNSSSRWLLVDRGRCYMILGEVKQALPNFAAAAERWPDFDQAFYNLGTALFRLGDKEAAKRAFDRSIELSESNRSRVETFLKRNDT